MKTTEENNRMIAEFMGYEFNEEHDFYVDKGGNCSTMEELRFNNSWDWLIPCLSKMTTIQEFQDDYERSFHFWEAHSQFDINGCYNELVLFIEWYNEQNHNHAGSNP